MGKRSTRRPASTHTPAPAPALRPSAAATAAAAPPEFFLWEVVPRGDARYSMKRSPLSAQQYDDMIKDGFNPRQKTELCRDHVLGKCLFGDDCHFAHGIEDLRQMVRPARWKSVKCRSFHKKGFCRYGARCAFIHRFSAKTLLTEPFTEAEAIEEDMQAILMTVSDAKDESIVPAAPPVSTDLVNLWKYCYKATEFAAARAAVSRSLSPVPTAESLEELKANPEAFLRALLVASPEAGTAPASAAPATTTPANPVAPATPDTPPAAQSAPVPASPQDSQAPAKAPASASPLRPAAIDSAAAAAVAPEPVPMGFGQLPASVLRPPPSPVALTQSVLEHLHLDDDDAPLAAAAPVQPLYGDEDSKSSGTDNSSTHSSPGHSRALMAGSPTAAAIPSLPAANDKYRTLESPCLWSPWSIWGGSNNPAAAPMVPAAAPSATVAVNSPERW